MARHVHGKWYSAPRHLGRSELGGPLFFWFVAIVAAAAVVQLGSSFLGAIVVVGALVLLRPGRPDNHRPRCAELGVLYLLPAPQRSLDQLVASGLVVRSGDAYVLTDAGRDRLREQAIGR